MPLTYPTYSKQDSGLTREGTKEPWYIRKRQADRKKRRTYQVGPVRLTQRDRPVYTGRNYNRVRNMAQAADVARAESRQYGSWYPTWEREPNAVRPGMSRGQQAWGQRYTAQAQASGYQPGRYGAGGAQYESAADYYLRTRDTQGFLQRVNQARSAPGSTYTPTYFDIYQSAYRNQYPRYPSPLGPVMLWSNYAPGYTQQQTAEGQQAGYQPYSPYRGYGGYGYGSRYGGGGGGYGGGSAAQTGYRPRNMNTPWYQAMIQWKI